MKFTGNWNLLAIFLFISLFSCEGIKREGMSERTEIKINLDTIPIVDEIRLSSFLQKENCRVVLLDTVSDALMGDINKMGVYGDYIVTLDRTVSKQVFVFDKTGKFLRKIGQKGLGPMEYVSPSDFACSIEEDKIFVLDFRLRKILTYSLSTGKFLGDIKIKPFASRIHCYEKDLYVDNPSYGQYVTDNLLVCLNAENGELKESFISPDTFNAGYDGMFCNEGGPFLQSGEGQFNYSQIFSNKVLKKRKLKMFPYLEFLSKDWILAKDLEDIDMNGFDATRKLLAKNKYYGINCLIETGDIVFCRIYKGMRTFYFFYDREKDGMFLTEKMKDDIHFDDVSWEFARLFYGGYDDDGFCMYQSPSEFERILAKECYDSPRFETLHQLGDNFNGAVFFYKFKE